MSSGSAVLSVRTEQRALNVSTCAGHACWSPLLEDVKILLGSATSQGNPKQNMLSLGTTPQESGARHLAKVSPNSSCAGWVRFA